MGTKIRPWLLLLLLVGYPGRAWADNPIGTYTPITKTATASTAQTDATLWTPASGFRFALMGCTISAKFAQTVELEVSDVDVVPPLYFESYGIKTIGGGATPIAVGATDAVLTYSTTATGHSPNAAVTALVCWGFEWAG